MLNTRFSITDGINQPVAITIDGVDDLYVVNLPNVTIYPLADTINGPSLLKTFTFDAGASSLRKTVSTSIALAIGVIPVPGGSNDYLPSTKARRP